MHAIPKVLRMRCLPLISAHHGISIRGTRFIALQKALSLELDAIIYLRSEIILLCKLSYDDNRHHHHGKTREPQRQENFPIEPIKSKHLQYPCLQQVTLE